MNRIQILESDNKNFASSMENILECIKCVENKLDESLKKDNLKKEQEIIPFKNEEKKEIEK